MFVLQIWVLYRDMLSVGNYRLGNFLVWATTEDMKRINRHHRFGPVLFFISPHRAIREFPGILESGLDFRTTSTEYTLTHVLPDFKSRNSLLKRKRVTEPAVTRGNWCISGNDLVSGKVRRDLMAQ